jgi:hypothetical protein
MSHFVSGPGVSFRLGLVLTVLTLFLSPLGASSRLAVAEEPIQADAPLRWWKGNLHTHSLWSDGNDFPEMIVEWYRTRDYNFLALTDHNVLSEGIRWMPYSQIEKRSGDQAFAKYRERFGDHWIETRGEPGTADYAVRLKPLDEFRSLMEERGKFILLQGEEITDRVMGKPVHMNATNIKQLILPVGGATVREAISNNLRAVEEQAERTGRPILLHVNHPNYGYAIRAEDLAAVANERFVEVYNGHPGVNHLGDAAQPGMERMWDLANTLRIQQLATPPLLGLATDDCHEYFGRPGSRPGRGWIMVRARFLTPEKLLAAIYSGDFYASSGVTLDDVQFNAEQRKLTIRVAAEADVTYQTDFIGTVLSGDNASASGHGPQGDPIGRVLKTVTGTEAEYQLQGNELYVRAVITASAPADDPSFEDQKKQAWTQPVGWSRHLRKP